jgi:MFS family permease
LSWGRDVFGLAIAIQNLLWGIGQPIAGAIADRFGAVRVLSAGALLYAAGLIIMSRSSTPGALDLSAGELARIDAAFPLGSRARSLPML